MTNIERRPGLPVGWIYTAVVVTLVLMVCVFFAEQHNIVLALTSLSAVALVSAVCFLTVWFNRRQSAGVVLCAFLASFIWLSFVFKYVVMLYYPELVWGASRVVDASAVRESLSMLFIEITPALCLFFLGLSWTKIDLGHNTVTQQIRSRTRVRFGLATWICTFAILLKAALFLLFGIGSAVAVGQGLPTFFISGSELVVRTGILTIVNVLLVYSLVLHISKSVKIVLVLVAANIGISLISGWKGELMFQTVLFAYFFLCKANGVSLPHYLRSRFRAPLVTTVILVLIAFPMIKEYRNSSRVSGNIILSLNSAVSTGSEEFVGFEILARVGGIGTYAAARYLGEGTSQNVDLILRNKTSKNLKEALYGDRADDVVSGFSSTQFAGFYFFGGVIGLYVGSLALGLGIRFITSLVKNVIIMNPITFIAVLPIICLLWCKLLLTGGNLIIRGKELATVLVLIWILERVFLRKSVGRN